MKLKLWSALFLISAISPLHGVITLEDADSLWLFDGGTVGTPATSGQIIDATGNHTVSSVGHLHWTDVPATGPYGGSTQGSGGHGLQFSPIRVEHNVGTTADRVQAAYFTSTNATVTGSSTIITRLRWDGHITDDAVTPWIINNGLVGWGNDPDGAGPEIGYSQGFLFGLTAGGYLNYYTAAAPTTVSDGNPVPTPSGATHTFSTSDISGAVAVAGSSALKLDVGVWYDVALVIDDLGDSDQKTTRVTFYLVGPDGELKFYERISTNIWGSANAGANLVVGTESTGEGTGNQRKTFNGAMDYLAIFDEALSQDDIVAIFAVPEPGRAVLVLAGLGIFQLRRRRQH